MLGDIFLFVTHLVMTFSVGDVHDILGIYLACSSKQHSFSLCLLWLFVGSNRAKNHAHFFFLGTTRTHRISPITIGMIPDWNCHDQVTDQELGAKQNVTKHLMVPTTVWVSPLIITQSCFTKYTVDLIPVAWSVLKLGHNKKLIF